MVPYHRAQVRGLERIPPGAALYVGNHNGGLYSADTWIFAAAVLRAHGMDAVPWGLAHDLVVDLPVLRDLLGRVGGVRAKHENALALFAAGQKVLVYPGGDLDAMRPWRHRDRVVFGDRTGFARLALRARVPMVPVVAAGAHSTLIILDDMRWLAEWIGAPRWSRMKVWPLMFALPWGLYMGPPPPYLPLPSRILIEVLPPVRFEPDGPKAAADDGYVGLCAARVEASMSDALVRLEAERTGRR